MLLIITNSTDSTVDYLIPKLAKSSIPFLRFDTDFCLERSSLFYKDDKVTLVYEGEVYNPHMFSAVWYRRPESLLKTNLTPEEKFSVCEWSEMFENFFAMIPENKWINHPANNARASHKIHQLEMAKKLKLRVPSSLVTMLPDQLLAFYQSHDKKIITKPLFAGCVNRHGVGNDSLIYTNRVTEESLKCIDSILSCPTLFQEEIIKKADIRITVLDGCMSAVKLVSSDEYGNQKCDIRVNNMIGVEYSDIEIPSDIQHKLILLLECYTLRFAAIDMIIDDTGSWFFLEVNPNGQWAWLDQVAGTCISDFFVNSLK